MQLDIWTLNAMYIEVKISPNSGKLSSPCRKNKNYAC